MSDELWHKANIDIAVHRVESGRFDSHDTEEGVRDGDSFGKYETINEWDDHSEEGIQEVLKLSAADRPDLRGDNRDLLEFDSIDL